MVDWFAAHRHEVYLPAGADWWNVATGEKHRGGQTVALQVTLASHPFFVKAGSVVPVGPDVQFNGEKPWDELEIRVFPGADGAGELYEDDFETYACERGEASRISFAWNDASRSLTIGERQGSFPGMADARVFKIVLPDGTMRIVRYDGARTVVEF